MSILYPSSLSDAEWDRLQELLPIRSPYSRLRRHTLRSVFDALLYLLRTGCPWRYLPCTFPPWQTVYYHCKQFCRSGLWTRLYRALWGAERRRVGKDPDPSAAIIDAHKWIKGRKRHLLVDALGLPLSVSVSPADMHDTQGARRLLAGLKYIGPTAQEDLG
jgi:putative transposase